MSASPPSARLRSWLRENGLRGVRFAGRKVHRLRVSRRGFGDDADVAVADQVFLGGSVAGCGEGMDFERDVAARVFVVQQVRGRDAVDPNFEFATDGLDSKAGPFIEAVGRAAALVVRERLEPQPVLPVVVEDAAGPAARPRNRC